LRQVGGQFNCIEDLDDVPVPSARYLNENSGYLFDSETTNEGEMVDVYIYNSIGSLLKMEKVFIGNPSEKELKSLADYTGVCIFKHPIYVIKNLCYKVINENVY
jgi:hypothetical protein